MEIIKIDAKNGRKKYRNILLSTKRQNVSVWDEKSKFQSKTRREKKRGKKSFGKSSQSFDDWLDLPNDFVHYAIIIFSGNIL